MGDGGPEDQDMNPEHSQWFRTGYLNGIYDALLGVKTRLSQEEFDELTDWVSYTLRPWAKENLTKAIRPPKPNSPKLQSLGRHGDGPFSVP